MATFLVMVDRNHNFPETRRLVELMPSKRGHSHKRVSRRRVIGSFGVLLSGTLAGCSGRIPGTSPAQLDVNQSVEGNRILWTYPPRDDGKEALGMQLSRQRNAAPKISLRQYDWNSTRRLEASPPANHTRGITSIGSGSEFTHRPNTRVDSSIWFASSHRDNGRPFDIL